MREKSEKSDKKPTLTKRMKDFLMIFENNMGLVGVSCKNSKVGQSTYYDWLGNKRFEEEISGIKTKVKDFGEHALFKLIKKGNPAAIIFFNKHKNRDRGYGDQFQDESEKTSQVEINIIESSCKEIKKDIEEKKERLKF